MNPKDPLGLMPRAGAPSLGDIVKVAFQQIRALQEQHVQMANAHNALAAQADQALRRCKAAIDVLLDELDHLDPPGTARRRALVAQATHQPAPAPPKPVPPEGASCPPT